MFVLGVLLSFVIPIFKELRAQEFDQTSRLEAISMLQERMELLSNRRYLKTIKGEETKKSRIHEKQTYEIKWKIVSKQATIVQIDVEVQWKDRRKEKKLLKLTTYRYQE